METEVSTFGAIAAHYAHLGLGFLFATIIAVLVAMVVHRVFQKAILSTLDEVRDSTTVFRALINKKTLNDSERGLLGRLAIAYAILSGAVFLAVMQLVSNLATPVG